MEPPISIGNCNIIFKSGIKYSLFHRGPEVESVLRTGVLPGKHRVMLHVTGRDRAARISRLLSTRRIQKSLDDILFCGTRVSTFISQCVHVYTH